MLLSTRELEPIVEMHASLEARAICRLDAWLAMMMKVVQNVKKIGNNKPFDMPVAPLISQTASDCHISVSH